MQLQDSVWVFQGAGARFPTGVYSSKETAESIIKHHKLCGLLTKYPLNQLIYDWALKNNYFHPNKESESTKEFKEKFTSSHQEHYHYEDGEIE